MSNKIIQSVLNLSPYKPAAQDIFQDNNVDNYLDKYKLDWNECQFPPHPQVIEKLINGLNSGILNFYSNVDPIDVVQKLADYSGVKVENLLIYAGSDHSHEHLATSLINPNDKLLILSPTYDNFRIPFEARGALIERFDWDNNKEFDLFKLTKKLNEDYFKVIYICNPNNPSGIALSLDEIKNLINLNPESVFIVDEAYYEYSNVSCVKLLSRFDNLIITRTFSKAFSLANLRIGYLLGHQNIISGLKKIYNPKSISTLSHIAIYESLNNVKYYQDNIKNIIHERNSLHKFLSNKPYVKTAPESEANYLLIEFINKSVRDNFYNHLHSNGINVRILKHNKLLNACLRITVPNSDRINYLKNVINEFRQ